MHRVKVGHVASVTRFPAWPGFFTYQLWLNGRVIYAGKTVHLRRRMNEHLRTTVIDTVTWKHFGTGAEMEESEASLIHESHPPLNRKCPRRCGYYGLAAGRRALARLSIEAISPPAGA